MTAKQNLFPLDNNGNPVPCMKLSSPEDIDGTEGHQESTPISGNMVRICAINGDIRFLVGDGVEAGEASHFLADKQEIWMPCDTGDVVSVYGGEANVATAGV